MELKIVDLEVPEGCNLILGQSHFIKTVEDLYEVLAETIPNAKFGIAFCEASGKKLIRKEGNDVELESEAAEIALKLSAGHVFVILIKNAFPIAVLNKIKEISEVCRIFCATANKIQAILAETSQGRGVLGVIDGEKSVGIESEKDKKEREEFLRNIGYKR